MKKTISITLAGIIFNIEEDGYNKLKIYLDAIREYFARKNESTEIMDDIEARAAEKFSECLSVNKQVVTLADVEELISSMGTIEDIAGEESTEKSEPEEKSWKNKKLYRDPDNAVIMGVCAGIANYFGIDPVIVRILFLLTLFFGGAGVLVYIALCFIVPEAKTTSQKMEMHGQPVNLSSLKEAAEEKIEAARKSVPAQPMRRIALTLGRLVRKIFLLALFLLALVMIAGSLAATLGIFVFFGNLLFNGDMIFRNFPEMGMLPGFQYHLVIMAGFFSALLPVIFAFFLGLSILRRKFILNLMASLSLLMIWIISISTLGVFVTRLVARHEERMKAIENSEMVTKNYDFRDFDSVSAFGNYNVKIEKGEDYKIEVEGHEADFDSILISQKGRNLEIDEDHRGICIFCYDSRTAENIIVTMPELKKFESDGMTRASVNGFNQDEISFDLQGTGGTTANVKTKSTKIDMDGLSQLTMSGSSENMTGKIDGVNDLDAQDFEVRNATLNVDGNGSVEVWVTEKLDAHADGTSEIIYKGNPEVTKKISAAARVEKR